MGASVSNCCSSAFERNELNVTAGQEGAVARMVLVEAKELGSRSSRSTAFHRSMTVFAGVRQKEFGVQNKTKVSAKEYSIGGLCTTVIKPLTMFKKSKLCSTSEEADSLLSYAEVGFRDSLRDIKKQPAFARLAMHFVSHAWRYEYSTFLGALANWDSHKGADVTYYWVDAFVVNQHIADSYPMEWWSTRFAQAVGDVGSTILVSLPWEDPIPLKRVWVIWEIFSAFQMGARFDIAMPKDTMDDFRGALINSFTTVQTALSGVDVALSSAYHKSHQEMVHDEIRRTIGFTKLNEMVQLRMNQWLIGAATKELQIMKQNANEKNKKEQIGLQDNLGRMLRESGNFEGAEFYFKDLLEEIERMYGKDHALALSCLNQLAVTLQKANHVEEALQCHRDCLQRRRRVLGENHEETLQSVSNLAVLSLHRPMSIEIFEEARSLYSLAVKGRELTIGEKDPRTLYTLSNFARFLSEAPEPSAELFNESDQLHQRAVQSLKDLLQQGHPLTLSSLHNQACSWLDRCVFQKTCSAGGPIDESISQLRLVHKLRVEKLGKEHPDTQQTERKLQEIARIQKQFANSDANGADQGRLESFPSFQDFFQAHFEVVHTAEEFQQVRKYMHEGIVADLVFDDLLASGFIDEDGFMTTGMQPYIFLAHIIIGELSQRKCEPEQDYLGTYGDTFVVAHNKPESDEMWHSSDPSWIGKASMSQRHRFLVFKNLRWEYFNVISLGLECGSQQALEALKEMKDAATHWVSQAPGWSKDAGFYLAAWPLTTVPCLHLHMVDLSCTGPSFSRLSKKMLLLDDAIRVLEAEVAEGIGVLPA